MTKINHLNLPSLKGRLWLISALLWLAVVLGGSAGLLVYSHTPGEEANSAPKIWPAASRLPHGGDLPTLVMFAHPKCPCTRASIGELNALMTHAQGQVNARVVFFRPEGVEENWADTDLWRSASAIPGVEVQSDEEGNEARNFHASTSGHVVLYDSRGQLLFRGGITEARGHMGDNAGRGAIVEILNRRGISNAATPTFGCPLQEAKPRPSPGKGS